MRTDVSRFGRRALVATVCLTIAACAPHRLYRTSFEVCSSSKPWNECAENALQVFHDPEHPEGDYSLSFVEFDDQGQLFSREQMWAVLNDLYERSGSQDLVIVAFVHGWKHSAAPGDTNIKTFRRALRKLSQAESRLAQHEGREAPHVAGVYLGWRGLSLSPALLKELTFWDRKNTAHKVGRGAVKEVLGRLDDVRQTAHVMGRAGTKLVVIGHSFGGAVVFSALEPIFEERFIHTLGPTGLVSDTVGFGDLVVLINPAFEALQFSSLSDMANERSRYFPTQRPLLAILTSEADDATKRAFPLGRHFSTLFEKERRIARENPILRETETIDQGRANVTTVGHFGPYRTHRLHAAPLPEVEATVAQVTAVRNAWREDEPGGRIGFSGSVLHRNERSAGRNPYLVVQVDEKLIRDHNDIDDPRVIEFIKELILISTQESPEVQGP